MKRCHRDCDIVTGQQPSDLTLQPAAKSWRTLRKGTREHAKGYLTRPESCAQVPVREEKLKKARSEAVLGIHKRPAVHHLNLVLHVIGQPA